MRLPYLQSVPSKGTATTSKFLGLNQNLIPADGEWAKLKNVSDRFFPAIGARPERGLKTATYTDPKGIMYKNGLFHIDGTKAYYKGVAKFDVSGSEKQLVGLGAYIVVFPDGIIYNTFKDEAERIQAEYVQSGTITFAPLSKDSAFTKITATDIGKTFAKNDNVYISGLPTSSPISGTFNDTTKIISASDTDYIVVTGALTETYTFNSGLKFERKMPKMDFVAEKDNRLFGCSSENHEIYCCKLGDPKNWYNYETGADNAWAATVGSDGDFTGCVKYSTYMMFFKEAAVHILRGYKPSNFQLNEKDVPGVRKGCDRSIQVIDETLYYVGRDGVYSYDGSIPQKISNNITADISDAVAGQYKSKLYISCKLDGEQTLLVYDTQKGIWDVEDNETFKFADESDGMLYFVDSENNHTSICGSRDELISWSMESGNLWADMLNQTYVSKLKLNLWLDMGSEVTVYMRFDEGAEWIQKGHIASTANKVYTLPIVPQRCAKCFIKLEGAGQFRLLAMSRDIEQGSELN